MQPEGNGEDLTRSPTWRVQANGQRMDAKIKVLTVDDHPMLREGVVARIQHQNDMTIVGEAENGEQALESFAPCGPT